MADTEPLAPTAPAETTAPEAQPVAENTQVQPVQTQPPAKTGEQVDEGDEGEEGRKRESGSQRSKRRIATLTAELAHRDQLLEDLQRRHPPSDPQRQGQQQQPPREADFNGDFLAYERARTAFDVDLSARRAIREELDRDRQAQQRRLVDESNREMGIAYQERVDEARERIPDFDSVMSKQVGTFVRDEVADEIMRSEKGPLIAYHLANNPERLRELNGLVGRELSRAVGRLEGSVRSPSANRQTKAPPPVAPLSGSPNPVFNIYDTKANTVDRIRVWREAKAKASA